MKTFKTLPPAVRAERRAYAWFFGALLAVVALCTWGTAFNPFSLFAEGDAFWTFFSEDFWPPAIPERAGRLEAILSGIGVTLAMAIAPAIKAAFTFLRAVPTPVWVLLMMVCVGMGPAAGIAGLCVHTTAFFTRAFAQSFEDIPAETLEALEATGVGRIGVFLNAVLPSALARVVAWVGMRLEINVAECAILGMVGAGGVGFVIANGIQNYEYGSAGVAILLVFVMAYFTERLFVFLKRRLR